MVEDAVCSCTRDVLCSEGKDPFHELMEADRNFATYSEREPIRMRFYEHRILAGFRADGLLRSE